MSKPWYKLYMQQEREKQALSALEELQAEGMKHSMSVHGDDNIHEGCPDCQRITAKALQAAGISGTPESFLRQQRPDRLAPLEKKRMVH